MNLSQLSAMFEPKPTAPIRIIAENPTTGKLQCRNSSCSCGSGKKFHQCCGRRVDGWVRGRISRVDLASRNAGR